MDTGMDKQMQAFGQQKTALEKLINESADLVKELDLMQHFSTLTTSAQKLSSDSFKVMVLGQFKTGKSTFINSFLGDEILPAYATPCTAVINEVKYAEKKRAILYFKDTLPKSIPSAIPQKILDHMRKHSGKVPPIDIPFDEIEDYVVIPMGKEIKESLLESPYEKVELYWPMELLQNGVEIIDSPGLNEHETRTKVTLEYLSNADAILFLMNAGAACAKTEMDFIADNLRKSGFEDVFYILNKFDDIRSPKEQERVRTYYTRVLKNETSFMEKGVFFASSYEALMGKLNKDMEQFQKSGLAEFENVLADFLTNERGRTKLSQPSRDLKRIIHEALFTAIPQQRAMLSTSLAEVEKRYAEAKPKLDNLETKKRQMSDKIDLSIERMLPEIRRCVQDYFNDLTSEIPVWLDEIQPENEFETLHPKESSKRIIQELLEKMQSKIESEQMGWQNNTLLPMVTDKIQGMMLSIEGNVENFFIELDQIKVDIAGGGSQVDTQRDISGLERVGAGLLGLIAGDIGSAGIGAQFGFSKTFFKQLAMQIGAVVGMVMLGITNPFTMLPVIIGIAVFGFFRGRAGVVNELKGKVAAGTIEELNKISSNIIDNIVTLINQKVTEIGGSIIVTLEGEIQAIRNQVDSIIKELKAGEAQVAIKRENLERCEKNLVRINQELDDFIFAVIVKK